MGLTVCLIGIDIMRMALILTIITKQWHLTKIFLTAIFVFHQFGYCLGYLTSGFFSDNWGRKPVILTCTAGITLLTFTNALSPNVYMFIACTFGIGYCGGVNQSANKGPIQE